MAENKHEIDQLFYQRFEGLKDHSVDPKMAWERFEAAKAFTGSSAMSASGSSSTAVTGVSGMAAAIGSALIVVGISTGDKRSLDGEQNNASAIVLTTESSADEKDLSSPHTENASFAFEEMADLGPRAQSEPIVSPSKTFIVDDSQEESLVSEKLVKHPEQLIADYTPYAESVDRVEESHSDLAKEFSLTSVDNLEPKGLPTRQNIALMKRTKQDQYSAALLPRAMPEIEDPTISAWNSSYTLYGRAAARSGTGESNSYEIKASSTVDPLISIGVGYALTDQSFITAEIGWLRKSGNGIERMRKIDVSPLISSFSNGGQAVSETNKDLIVHESLIATRLDYIHIPIAYHLVLSNMKLFSDKWTAFAGPYFDVLAAAQNENYMIYNSDQYKLNDLGIVDASTLNGLRRLRFGAGFGLERQISRQLSAIATVTLPPFNGPVNEKSDYEVFGETNKPLDIHLGVKFFPFKKS